MTPDFDDLRWAAILVLSLTVLECWSECEANREAVKRLGWQVDAVKSWTQYDPPAK